MAVIQLNRGESSSLPALALLPGEPAFALDTGKLYVGNALGQKILINPDMLSALQADKLSSEREIKISGDAQGAVFFDGSKNVQIDVVLSKSGATAGEYTKVTIDEKGRVILGDTLAVDDIPNISLDKVTNAGTAATYNVGVSKDNVPILGTNGKLPLSTIPATAITDTFVVNSESEMVALDAQIGDIAVRTDINKTFILKTAPAASFVNWQELLISGSNVTSVNSKVGVVVLTADDVGAVPTTRTINSRSLSSNITLTKADIGLPNVVNESKTVMFTNPVFIGAVKAPTPAADESSTIVATTAFVKAQNYMSESSTVDGGVF